MLLYDECVSILFRDNNPKLRRAGLRVVDVLGRGTKDPRIEVYAARRKMRIVTVDNGLIFNQIKKAKPVCIVNKRTGEIFALRAKKIGQLKPRHDPVTHHMRSCGGNDVIRA